MSEFGLSDVSSRVTKELEELYGERERIWNLTKTNLKMEYGLSKLGFFWSFLEPAGIILVFSLVFPLILGMDFYSWVLFFIAGFIPHRFTEEGMTRTSQSLVDKKNILNEIDIKEEIIPISTALTSTVKFMLECFVFFSIIFASGLLPTFSVLFFPLLVLIHFFIILGFGMHLSVTYVNVRDLDHIFAVFFQALLFLTPIVYRLNQIPQKWRGIYLMNPLSRLIMLYQKSLLQSLEAFTEYIPTLQNILLLFLFSLIALVLGYYSFKKRKKKFIGEI